MNRISRVLPRALIREVLRPLPRGKYLQDGWRAGAYRLLLGGQVHALTVLFGACRADHTRADDLSLSVGTASLARSTIQPRLYAQVPETIPEASGALLSTVRSTSFKLRFYKNNLWEGRPKGQQTYLHTVEFLFPSTATDVVKIRQPIFNDTRP